MTDYLETNGARIAYDVAGSGEPVLLVHAGVATGACGTTRSRRCATRTA